MGVRIPGPSVGQMRVAQTADRLQPFSCSKQDRGAKIRKLIGVGPPLAGELFLRNGLPLCFARRRFVDGPLNSHLCDPHSLLLFVHIFNQQPPTSVTLVFRPILIPKERQGQQNKNGRRLQVTLQERQEGRGHRGEQQQHRHQWRLPQEQAESSDSLVQRRYLQVHMDPIYLLGRWKMEEGGISLQDAN